jgi:hypothetical protein
MITDYNPLAIYACFKVAKVLFIVMRYASAREVELLRSCFANKIFSLLGLNYDSEY